MKKKICSSLTMQLAFILALALFNRSNALHADQTTDMKSPIEITSESMIADKKKNTITFIGSVVAKKDNIILYSDRMDVHYSNGRDIEEIVARNNVRLIQEKREIKANKAIYRTVEEKIIFTGNPVFSEEMHTVTGTSITYFISSERSIVENSKVILR